jgi:hypothetical protein
VVADLVAEQDAAGSLLQHVQRALISRWPLSSLTQGAPEKRND